jgi:hypothetical protein
MAIVIDPLRFSAVFGGASGLREAELAGDEIEHGDHVRGGTVAARFTFGGAEHAVESFRFCKEICVSGFLFWFLSLRYPGF